LDFTFDDSSPEIKQEAGVTEDGGQGADLEKGGEKENVQEEEPEKGGSRSRFRERRRERKRSRRRA